MIEAKNGKVKGKGTDVELLTDLTEIIKALITEDITEEMVDVAVGLAKALVNGTEQEYKEKTKEKFQKKKNAGIKTMAINLNELIKQVKEEKEKDEE